MDSLELASAVVNFHDAARIGLSVIPLATILLAWLRLRLKHQRQYIKLVRSLPRYPQFLAARTTALRTLDAPLQFRYEELERQIAVELSLNLKPEMTGTASYLRPANSEFLLKANRHLSASVFRDFSDDLLLRLCLLLDSMSDLQQHRRTMRWVEDRQAHSAQREHLRSQLDLDVREIERHLRLMKLYLSGHLEPNTCSEEEASMYRSWLSEKYRAYVQLSDEDAQQFGVMSRRKAG